MPEERLEVPPRNDNNEEQNEESFESDTQKIVRRHLENKDDVITDEDIRNVRIGMTPPLDAPTEEAVREWEGNEKVADKKAIDEDETMPGEQEITPWDVITPDE
ncbi:MAG: hypothetical protein ACTHMD_03735 [Flavisolibacter sp.]